MATNLSIDPDLIERAWKSAASARRRPPSPRRLRSSSPAAGRSGCSTCSGKLEWDPTYDYKADRSAIEPLRRHQRLVARASARRATCGAPKSRRCTMRSSAARRSSRRDCPSGTAPGLHRPEGARGDPRPIRGRRLHRSDPAGSHGRCRIEECCRRKESRSAPSTHCSPRFASAAISRC